MSFCVDSCTRVPRFSRTLITGFLSGTLLTISCIGSLVRADEGKYIGPIGVVASPDQTVLYVVAYDAARIDVLDVSSEQVLRSMDCPARPTSLAVKSDGSELYVCCEGPQGVVCVFDSGSGQIKQKIGVGHTPSSVVVLAGQRLAVCNRFNNDVSIVSLADGQQITRIPVLREPVSAAVTPDSSLLVVANLLPTDPADATTVAAEVSLIKLADQTVNNVRLPNGSSSLRSVCVSPDGNYAYVAHILSRYRMPTTQLERGWMNTNALSVIDLKVGKLINTVLLDEIDLGAANPYAVTTSADGARILVTHAGSHEMSVINAQKLIEKLAAMPKTAEEARAVGRTNAAGYASTTVDEVPNDLTFLVDIRERIRLRKRWFPGLTSDESPVVNGPRGLAVIGSSAYVAVYFSDLIAKVELDSQRYDKVKNIALGPVPEMSLARFGEMYFHDADICFQQWQSCSSCHPNARVDSLNWDLLNDDIGNPKNAKSMLLAHETPPAMSFGIRATAEDAVRAGIRHIQFAVPPEEKRVPESIDEYLKALKPVPSPYLQEGKLSAAAERGKVLFESSRINCARCHPAPLYTDLKLHDVGSRSEMDRRDDFDTPTLIEVWRTAPYMHDGHFATIKELIEKGKHGLRGGEVESLTPQELDDLVQYVLSL